MNQITFITAILTAMAILAYGLDYPITALVIAVAGIITSILGVTLLVVADIRRLEQLRSERLRLR